MEPLCAVDFCNVTADFSAFSLHLVLLDISLPFMDGYYWCREIRKVSKVPIVFISSAADNMNIIMAMNMGSDDFIAKHFDVHVLIAKVQALLRRTYDFGDSVPVIAHRGAMLNTGDGTFMYGGERISLSKNEYRILLVLMTNKEIRPLSCTRHGQGSHCAGDGLDSLVSGEEEGILREGYTKTLAEYGAEAENVLDSRYVTLAGLLKAGRLEAGRGVSETTSLPDYDKVRQIYLISAEDYNAVMGTALMPSRGQAYLYTFRCEYEEDTLSVGDLCLRVAGRLNEFPLMPDASVSVIPSLMLVVADYEVLRPLDTLADKNGNVFSSFNWYYAYDVDAPDEVIAEIYRQRDGAFSLFSREDGYRYSSACRPLEKQSYYMLYGSLFFLGILLSIVFVFAAVLIIYCSAFCTHWCTRSRPTLITALSAVMAKNKHHYSGRKVEKNAVQHVSACCYPEK